VQQDSALSYRLLGRSAFFLALATCFVCPAHAAEVISGSADAADDAPAGSPTIIVTGRRDETDIGATKSTAKLIDEPQSVTRLDESVISGQLATDWRNREGLSGSVLRPVYRKRLKGRADRVGPKVMTSLGKKMVGAARIELATPAMSTQCSTTELRAHGGGS
jgi:hypothetical protein